MRDWLTAQWEWLATAVFIAVITSTTIGFREGSKGGAIFVSNAASAILAMVIYPFLEKWGYNGPFVGLLGLFCGACGMAMFGVLISLSSQIDKRRVKLAEGLIDRVAPGSGDDKP